MIKQTALHPDLLAAQKLVYEPNKLLCDNPVQEAESLEYGACKFTLNGKLIHFRVAKITPAKIGQFVTFWKRNGTGPIMPYDIADEFDYLVVSVRANDHFGQFIFPKQILSQKKVISKEGIDGKRALRVYPPWDNANNLQAKKTQAWQLNYFFEIQPKLDAAKMQQLLFNEIQIFYGA